MQLLYIIRDLTEQAIRLRSSPEELSNVISSLSSKPDAALAGFLYRYLAFGKNGYSKEQLAAAYIAMLDKLMSAADQEMLGAFLGSMYQSIPLSNQLELATRLIDFAQRRNSDLQVSVFHCMDQIAAHDHLFLSAVAPVPLARARDAYLELAKEKKLVRSPPLEAALGVGQE